MGFRSKSMNPRLKSTSLRSKALLSIEELAQQLLHFWNPCGAASKETQFGVGKKNDSSTHLHEGRCKKLIVRMTTIKIIKTPFNQIG